ncbi:MAG: epoxyqueuosine reductase QueH [Candidatus Riflebacteria bacterium]|nr:epoxyqueuosine reductase QueH [Candidatus Riflebacteria bacterium]
MNILLHSCCGPCLGGSVRYFSENGHSITAFWDNPNIHPLGEYNSRFESFCRLTDILKIPVIIEFSKYMPERYFKAINGNFDSSKCYHCFKLRFKSTAETASENNFDAFSTTLRISPYQNHEMILKAGRELAEEYNIKFFEVDLRDRFKLTYQVTRDHQLYKQKYCGCLFSEKERFASSTQPSLASR